MSVHLFRWELAVGPALGVITLLLLRGCCHPASAEQRAFNGGYLLVASYYLAWAWERGPFLANMLTVVLLLVFVNKRRLRFPIRGFKSAIREGPVGIMPAGQSIRVTAPRQSPELRPGQPPKNGPVHGVLIRDGRGRHYLPPCPPCGPVLQDAAHCLPLHPN